MCLRAESKMDWSRWARSPGAEGTGAVGARCEAEVGEGERAVGWGRAEVLAGMLIGGRRFGG